MADSKVLLVGAGNPLLDISAHVEKDVLEKYDLKANLACLAEEKHLPLYGELVEKYKVEYIAGGATQNSIRVAQWMLPTPKSSAYIGCIGKDTYGKQLAEEAEKDNVITHYREDDKAPTGTCAVLVTGKERTLVANIAAANEYKIDHLSQPEVWASIESANTVYISGFFLTVSPPSILKIAEFCAEKEKTFVMNLAAPFICQFFKDPMTQCIPYWDIVVGNETEAEAFAENNEFGTKDLKEIALKLSQLPKKTSKPRIAIVTHGAEPTLVATAGKVEEYPVTPISADEIVDTNGAGDAFVGGLLSQLVQGKSITEAVAAGQWAASVIIKRSGCTFPDTCSYTSQ